MIYCDTSVLVAGLTADRDDLKLRAGDALHLATASLGGHHLVTLDKTMSAGAVAVGVGLQKL